MTRLVFRRPLRDPDGLAPRTHLMVEVAEQVAAALAAGRPVVALESTIIAHGLPRPDNLRAARQFEGDCPRRGRRAGDDRGRRRPGAWSASRRRAGARSRADGVPKLSVRDLGPGGGARRHGATTWRRRRSSPPRRHPGLRHRRPRRRAPRRARASTSRPTRRPRADPDHRGVRGVKSILDVGATLERLETLGGRRGRLRHRPLPRLLAHRRGLDPWTGASNARRGRRGPCWPAELRAAARRCGGQPAARRRAAGPRAARPRARRGPRRPPSAAGVAARTVTPVPARALPRGDRRREPAVNVRIVLRNAALAAADRRRMSDGPVVVLGNVMSDVPRGSPRRRSRGATRRRSWRCAPAAAGRTSPPGGLARAPVALIGCVGDDEAGRGAARSLATSGVTARLVVDPGRRARSW